MDKSFIELLKTVGNQIDNTELTAAINADNFDGEFALSEGGLSAAKEQVGKLLTIESAINNPAVIERINKDSYPKHMKTALSKIEAPLKEIYDAYGVDYSDAEYISDKIGDLKEKLASAVASGDNKEVINSLNEELRLARAIPSKLEEEYNNKIQARDESDRVDKIKSIYVSKATENQWADIYSDPDLKTAVLNQKWDNINAKAQLILSEDGKDVRLMQKDMPDKELYDGNNKLMTFQSMLEPEFEKYYKKSSPEKVRTPDTIEKPSKDLTAQETRNLNELAAQKRMYAS